MSLAYNYQRMADAARVIQNQVRIVVATDPDGGLDAETKEEFVLAAVALVGIIDAAERRRDAITKAAEARRQGGEGRRRGRAVPGHQDTKEFTGRDWKKLAAGDDGEIGGTSPEETKS